MPSNSSASFPISINFRGKQQRARDVIKRGARLQSKGRQTPETQSQYQQRLALGHGSEPKLSYSQCMRCLTKCKQQLPREARAPGGHVPSAVQTYSEGGGVNMETCSQSVLTYSVWSHSSIQKHNNQQVRRKYKFLKSLHLIRN